MIYQDEEELQESLSYWQDVLRLRDWIIKARIVRRWEIRDGCVGQADWQLESKMASIKILDSVDYEPIFMIPIDQEHCLVHELLHLHFAPFTHLIPKDSIEYAFMELAIDTLSDSLVKIKRKGGKPE